MYGRVPWRRRRGRGAVRQAAPGVDAHAGDARRLARGKLQPPELLPYPGVAGLELGVRRELEGEPAEGEGEDVALLVELARVGGAERLVDLLDGGGHLGAVEQDVAVGES